MSDAVSHPAHYHPGKHEVIDVVEAWGLGFCLGNVVKYVARHALKGAPLEDLKKARWYLDRAIAEMERSPSPAAEPWAEPCDRCNAPNATHGLGQYLLCDICRAECDRSRGGFKFQPTESGVRRAAARETAVAAAIRAAEKR